MPDKLTVDGKSFSTDLINPTQGDVFCIANVSGYKEAKEAINLSKTKQQMYAICLNRVSSYSIILGASIESMISIQSRMAKIAKIVDFARAATNEVASTGNNALTADMSRNLSKIDDIMKMVSGFVSEMVKSQSKIKLNVDNAAIRLTLLSEDSSKVRKVDSKKSLLAENPVMNSLTGFAMFAKDIFAFDYDISSEVKNFNKISQAINANLDIIVSIAINTLEMDFKFRGQQSFKFRNSNAISKDSLSESAFNTKIKLANSTIAILWSNSEKTPIRDYLRMMIKNLAENSPEFLAVPQSLVNTSASKNLFEVVKGKLGNLLHKLYYGKITDVSSISDDDIATIAAFSNGAVNESDIKAKLTGKTETVFVPRYETKIPPAPNVKNDTPVFNVSISNFKTLEQKLEEKKQEKKTTEENLDKSTADLESAEDKAAKLKEIDEQKQKLEAQEKDIEAEKKKVAIEKLKQQAADAFNDGNNKYGAGNSDYIPVPSLENPVKGGPESPLPPDTQPLAVSDKTPDTPKSWKDFLNTKNLLIAAAVGGVIILAASSKGESDDK